MKFFLIFFFSLLFVINSAKVKPKKEVAKQVSTTTPAPDDKPPTIDWGKCPQLEPKDSDKAAKAAVLEKCLKSHPVPPSAELTEQKVKDHQTMIAECALKAEKWFNKNGSYKYSKAETEIKNKKLVKTIESLLLENHKKCETEAKKEFKDKKDVIEQVQLYQACMDFHITTVCEIQLKQN